MIKDGNYAGIYIFFISLTSRIYREVDSNLNRIERRIDLKCLPKIWSSRWRYLSVNLVLPMIVVILFVAFGGKQSAVRSPHPQWSCAAIICMRQAAYKQVGPQRETARLPIVHAERFVHARLCNHHRAALHSTVGFKLSSIQTTVYTYTMRHSPRRCLGNILLLAFLLFYFLLLEGKDEELYIVWSGQNTRRSSFLTLSDILKNKIIFMFRKILSFLG